MPNKCSTTRTRFMRYLLSNVVRRAASFPSNQSGGRSSSPNLSSWSSGDSTASSSCA